MIGVLLFSKKESVSSWAAVRGSKRVRISGMSKGDRVELEYDTGMGNSVTQNDEFDLPEGIERLKATHVEVGENPDVCVDLMGD